MSSQMATMITSYLRQLHLPAFAQHCEQQAQVAARRKLGATSNIYPACASWS